MLFTCHTHWTVWFDVLSCHPHSGSCSSPLTFDWHVIKRRINMSYAHHQRVGTNDSWHWSGFQIGGNTRWNSRMLTRFVVLWSLGGVEHLYVFCGDKSKHPSKPEVIIKCRCKVGPPSSMLAQHCNSIEWMLRVCLDGDRREYETSSPVNTKRYSKSVLMLGPASTLTAPRIHISTSL